MDAEQIATLERLEREATAGPWETADKYDQTIVRPGFTRKGDGTPKRKRDRDSRVVSIENSAACGDPECCTDHWTLNLSPQDAALIVAMRNALPDLLAAAKEHAAVRAWCKKWRDQPGTERHYPSLDPWAHAARELETIIAVAALSPRPETPPGSTT